MTNVSLFAKIRQPKPQQSILSAARHVFPGVRSLATAQPPSTPLRCVASVTPAHRSPQPHIIPISSSSETVCCIVSTLDGRSNPATIASAQPEKSQGSEIEYMDPPKELNEIVLPQTVVGPLTRSAIFLVVCIRPGEASYAAVRSFCADLSGLVRAVEFRDAEAGLTCVVGFGSDAWDKIFGSPRPAELHPFKEFRAGNRHAVSTPGDILFHIRAKREDLCFELAMQIMDDIGDVVTVADETHGFRYFDDRDVIGFVDGTENPRGGAAQDAAIVGSEDAAFAGGSYVVVQKYMHDMKGWNALPVETQENIIGRKKLSDIELKDDVKPANAHNALTSIEENGKELKILRDNMPFGRPGHGEFGTYFIGYARTPHVTETMLENMFVGKPPGNYDRLLDFSTPVTGSMFFAPSSTFLDDVSGDPPAATTTGVAPEK
jgi:porphyrinogen peroxidase